MSDRLEDLEARARERCLELLIVEEGPIAQVARAYLEKLNESCLSLGCLTAHAANHWDSDGAAILRGSYEAMLQVLHLFQDPHRVEARARSCLNYTWVQRHRMRELFRSSGTDLGTAALMGPKFREIEPEIDKGLLQCGEGFLTREGVKHLARQGPKYLLSNNAAYRMNWFEGSWKSLATEAGYEREHGILYSDLSSAAHSSPMGVLVGAINRRKQIPYLASRCALRAAGRIGLHFKFKWSELEALAIERAGRVFFNLPDEVKGRP